MEANLARDVDEDCRDEKEPGRVRNVECSRVLAKAVGEKVAYEHGQPECKPSCAQ